ncbi:hypothetical protein GIB67_020268 [Kingdonia uniflora]|uniref:Methyltransferase n=1 Tax=Kingdonia uniflora TaxID=39325 RepID=A0A7J7P3R2_9MAGN|nr:hypothetical protein GIB67_020268 [Kingdonia uniflora]
MDPTAKPSPGLVRNLLVRVFSFCVFVLVLRFVYVVTIAGGSCDAGDFCFFSIPDTLNFASVSAGVITGASAVSGEGTSSSVSVSESSLNDLWTSKEWRNSVDFHSGVFQDLMAESYLNTNSKALCVETLTGVDVFALKEIGVHDVVGIAKKAVPPLVKFGKAIRIPFEDDMFDFVFSGGSGVDRYVKQAEFASEIGRTLKPEGFLVVHTNSAKDTYSFNSFIGLFNCCRLVRHREIDNGDTIMPSIHEIVLKKEYKSENENSKLDSNIVHKCSVPVPGFKHEIVRNAENIISEEPLKPWLTLKRNLKNIKYLSSMVDINFKKRYVYVDVGARSYGSSIGSWFKKQYPKQNKTFEIYAIEADKAFHEEYKSRKGVNLLPYAAWVRNETLFFEINGDPGQKMADNKTRGMGRIQPGQSSTGEMGNVNKIQGFDFANWLKNTVSERDYVVMKMDVEGTEFDLIPRLFETGAICLIDEIFLECHYNRWQKCCPGERSSKYENTYDQCLELFGSLRKMGILVHQWF